MTTLSDRRTRALQRFLISQGYDLGQSADDGIGGPKTLGAFDEAFEAFMLISYKFPVTEIDGLTLANSGIEEVIKFETGGRDYYDSRLSLPSWPGVYSGVTIGIGYDLGYHTAHEIQSDWEGLGLSNSELQRLVAAAGITGQAASHQAGALKDILIPWEMATKVFVESTLPKYTRLTARAFPGVEALHPIAQAILLSLVFNRGTSMSGDRRVEMANIRDLVSSKNYEAIAKEVENMRRLWPNVTGLLKRRTREAELLRSIA